MRDRRRRRTQFSPEQCAVLTGFLAAAIGLILLLQNFGIVFDHDVRLYWPVVLIVLGAVRIERAQTGATLLAGAAITVSGLVFFLCNLQLPWITWLSMRPVWLIGGGVLLAAQAMDRVRYPES